VSAIALIDHAAFAHNVRVLSDRISPAEVMLAVKADAYGHGMRELAPVALSSGATSLAVLEIPAALALREAGVQCTLFAWLHGPSSDFAAAIDANLDLGVSALWQLELIAAAASVAAPARVHLKIDTGLRRNGALPEQWPELVSAARVLRDAGVITIEGIWSHLADASPDDDERALDAFTAAVATAAGLGVVARVRHIAASSAGWREPRARLDLVRFGIAAYGISPFDDLTGSDLGLRAVMTLQSTVQATDAPAGHLWVAAGYAQGVPLEALDGEVSIDGARCRVVRIDLDRTLVAVDREFAPGTDVTIFGEPATGVPSAEDWAKWSGTIGDEIVTGVPASVARQHLPVAG